MKVGVATDGPANSSEIEGVDRGGGMRALIMPFITVCQSAARNCFTAAASTAACRPPGAHASGDVGLLGAEEESGLWAAADGAPNAGVTVANPVETIAANAAVIGICPLSLRMALPPNGSLVRLYSFGEDSTAMLRGG